MKKPRVLVVGGPGHGDVVKLVGHRLILQDILEVPVPMPTDLDEPILGQRIAVYNARVIASGDPGDQRFNVYFWEHVNLSTKLLDELIPLLKILRTRRVID